MNNQTDTLRLLLRYGGLMVLCLKSTMIDDADTQQTVRCAS
jgi:hypothetical protein